jgi:hypothetical protein
MQTVTAFKTTDEKLFANKAEAVAHQAKIDFYAWYGDRKNDNQIYCHDHYTPSEDVVNWLEEHKGYLRDYLGKIGA